MEVALGGDREGRNLMIRGMDPAAIQALQEPGAVQDVFPRNEEGILHCWGSAGALGQKFES